MIGLPPTACTPIGANVSVAIRPLADDALMVIVSVPLADVPAVAVPLVPVPDVPVVLVPEVAVLLVPALLARMTTELLPAVVGVPDMAPVAAFILKPAGRPVAA